jgi:hypothetical protein
MPNYSEKLESQWKDVVNLVLGAWLIVSPWVWGFIAESRPTWNAWVFGVVIAIAALAALVSFNKWEEWVNAVFGAWLIVSPFILGFSGLVSAMWNQIIVGVIVGVLAIWSAMAPQPTGHATSK